VAPPFTGGPVTGYLGTTVIAVVAGFILLWLALVILLIVTRPADLRVTDILRLLPDVVVLLRRLAADPELPRGVRIRLGLLLVYLILPIDLIPDFIPVLGYADDAIIVALALRSVTRRAGPAALERHWPGTAEGLQAVRRLAGIRDAET
jgi:uncharacterized membrane protein YkvA (DUF1232 family)